MDAIPTRPASTIKQRATHWREAVLVCRKCSKKMGGGFGAKKRTSLRKLLREALHLKKGRKAAIGVVEVGCFDLCPKRAVTVAVGSRPRTLYVIPRGTPLDEIVATLGLGGEDRASP
jgi:predicted metal-binding protein